MVATVMAAAGLAPTAVVGGKVNVLDSNAKLIFAIVIQGNVQHGLWQR